MRIVERWTTVGRAFRRTSLYRIATHSRAQELRVTGREGEKEVEIRSDFPKGHSTSRHIEIEYHGLLVRRRH